ncbi:MAG: undecaprenyldiphospho-muramoylpentapeptide beta-N-acetylglucosaminyltransferase [Bacteroidota bacterium]|nr:undecaprenyldiphospho-muramoylpentapeptide beta-N-acetylglucosaminyltransferase [Bacteroidota bacterium]
MEARHNVRILVAGGGTGGHLFPALAIADEIKKLLPAARIAFAGTKKKIEARVVPQQGYEFHPIWISGFHRRLTVENMLFPLKVVVALVQSFFLIRKFQPDVVVGTGGYVCGPVLYVASLFRIPTIVHESNSYPGVTTRMLASSVSKIFITFDGTRKWLKTKTEKVVLVGNPTRAVLGTISHEDGIRYFNLDPAKKTLFVFGGSLGAVSINNAMEKIVSDLVHSGIQIVWQTGGRDFENIRSSAFTSSVWTGTFIDAIEYAYAAADVVLSRAGATTVAELTRLGKPAILVPLPSAAANHQEMNARALMENNAAVIVHDSELEAKILDTIKQLFADERRRSAMSDASRKLGKPNAGEEIARKILELVSTN